MSDKFNQYAARQKQFWNVSDAKSAMFERIDLFSEESENIWYESAAQAVNIVLDCIEPEPEWTILEIGCGVGRIIDQMSKRTEVQRFIGVDISENMIEFAREYLGEDEKVELFVNNGYDLEMIDDNVIDFAYSIDVFIHIFDVDIAANYLNEVCRVLKDGGLFRFNVRYWDPNSSFGDSIGGNIARWMYKLGIWSAGKHRWAPEEPAEFNGNHYMVRDIERLVKRSGLIVTETRVEQPHLWCTLRKQI